MAYAVITKPAFTVVGKEGSTLDGEGFVQRLWAEANAHFSEVAHLARKDAAGNLAGIWGSMTDFSRAFSPWEEGFSQGLYLAGVECGDDAQAPEGWTCWHIPGFVYVAVPVQGEDTFSMGLAYLAAHGWNLVGAAQDFTNPQTGEITVLFPIQRLD